MLRWTDLVIRMIATDHRDQRSSLIRSTEGEDLETLLRRMYGGRGGDRPEKSVLFVYLTGSSTEPVPIELGKVIRGEVVT